MPTGVKVAIIGHPNVGKSTLLNRLTGRNDRSSRPIPGTTRDAVDEVVERMASVFDLLTRQEFGAKAKLI